MAAQEELKRLYLLPEEKKEASCSDKGKTRYLGTRYTLEVFLMSNPFGVLLEHPVGTASLKDCIAFGIFVL